MCLPFLNKETLLTNNLWSIIFLNDHCREEQVEAGKMAFDTLSHGYIETNFRRYGFGPKLIKFFGTL